ncbi:MAG: membrane dipeptidase [Pseudomonadota bacterium]
MRRAKTLLLSLVLSLGAAPAIAQSALSDPDVMELHDRLLTIDTHIDIGPGYGTNALDPGVLNLAQVNLPGMRIGGLDAGFFVVYAQQGALTPDGYKAAEAAAEEKYRGIVRMLRANPDKIALATTASEVKAINRKGKLVALIGIENSYPLGSTPAEVETAVAKWAARGALYASITHFGHNQFGGSSNPVAERGDGEDAGLTDLGRVLVASLNDHGMMVDVSHVGAASVADAIEASRAPVIASHSTVAGVYDNPRGLTDAQLEAIRDNGGVAQITAFRSYIGDVDPRIEEAIGALRARLGLTSYAAYVAASPATLSEFARERTRIRREFDDITLDQFLDHVERAIAVAGIDHVGLSGDFDGGGGVAGWDSAADSPNVTAGLLARGYSEEDLEKIWGGNVLRVMRAVEKAATK